MHVNIVQKRWQTILDSPSFSETVLINTPYFSSWFAFELVAISGSTLTLQDVAFMQSTELTPKGRHYAWECLQAMLAEKSISYLLNIFAQNKKPNLNFFKKIANKSALINFEFNPEADYKNMNLIKQQDNSEKTYNFWLSSAFNQVNSGFLPIIPFNSETARTIPEELTQAFWLCLADDPRAEEEFGEIPGPFPFPA